MESLQERLRQNGVRPSLQRLKIFEYLVSRKDHPTVEMIWEALRREMPTLSKTTIYNTLTLFVARGLIADLNISGNDVRYDAAGEPHAHFLCKECGQVLDLEKINSPQVGKEVEGNQVQEVHVYLKGLCKNCLRRE